MQEADRKLAWSAVVVLAVIAIELAWFLLVGPADNGPSAGTQQAGNPDYSWWQYSGAWIALFTVVLTVSTVLLWFANERMLRQAALSSESQLRAYLNFSVDGSSFKFVHGEKWTGQVIYQNSGHTPAVRAISAGELDILPWPPPIPFPDPVFDADGSIYVVHPGLRSPWITPFESRRVFSREEIAEAFVGKTKRIYLYGEIRYSDVFGKQHFTRFRMMQKADLAFLTFCREGNETDD